MALTAPQRLTVGWDSVALGLAAREQTRIDCVAFSSGEKVSERFESCLFMERYVGEKTVFNPFRPAAASQSFSLRDAIVAFLPLIADALLHSADRSSCNFFLRAVFEGRRRSWWVKNEKALFVFV